jgi:hypothetical protein
LVFHNDGFVAHGRHIRTACRAATHHHRDLRQPLGAHIGLVKEDAAKVVAVGEHLVLVGQVSTARVHQVNARQVVLLRNFLRTQMLLHREGVIRAAFHGGVVAHNHAVHTADAADAHDQASARCVVVVHVERSEWGHF